MINTKLDVELGEEEMEFNMAMMNGSPAWDEGEFVVKCKNCGKKMYVATTVRNPAQFCSQACQMEHKEVN